MLKYLLVPIFILTWLLPGPVFAEAKNLVCNGGFENGGQGWETWRSSDTDSAQFSIESGNAAAGSMCYKFGRVWGGARPSAGIKSTSYIPIESGSIYLLEMTYRTEGISEYSLPLRVTMRVGRADHETLRYGKVLSASPQWRTVKLSLEHLPADSRSVEISIAMGVLSRGHILLDEISLVRADVNSLLEFEEWRRQEAPQPVGDARGLHYQPSDYFSLKQDNGRWWLVEPSGAPTWSIGTMAGYPSAKGNGERTVAAWAQENYPDKMEYCRMLYGLLIDWGFNSFAGWTSDEMAQISAERYAAKEPYFPMFRVLGLSRLGPEKPYYAKNRDGKNKAVHDHSFPDPFDPRWKRDARKLTERLIPQYRDEPSFCGWYADNEIDFSGLYNFIWGEYSAREFVAWLENKYSSIGRLNAAWSSGFARFDYDSFQDIIKDKPFARDFDDPVFGDMCAFERIMMAEYVNYTVGLIRELDPNHLVISNRINLSPMPSFYRTADLWRVYDLICVNIYPSNALVGFSPGELEVFRKTYELTGRPVIVGEWSVPAFNSGLYDPDNDPLGRRLDWSWPQVVRTQRERGEVYRMCLRQMASLPFVVGSGWFKPLDVDSPGRRSNRGIIYGKHQVYTEFVEALREAHGYLKHELGLSR